MNSEVKPRVDDLDRYYGPIDSLERWIAVLFWISAVLSVVVLYPQWIPQALVQDLPELLFSVSVVGHLALSLYVRFYLIPVAEAKRRKQLISDSLGVPLTSEKTQAYYNNQLAPSIRRLGANILENAFFASAVCGRMVVRERIKIAIYFVVWFCAFFWRSTPVGVLVVITQTVFSGDIITKWVSLEILHHRNAQLYDQLYREFMHGIDFESQTGLASIMDAFSTYESVKAGSAIKQSTPIFNRLNPDLTKEWDNIRRTLGVDEEKAS